MKRVTAGAIVLAAIGLASCKLPFVGGDQPTGQVVAKVGDREITIRELHAELAGAPEAPPAQQKQMQQAALGNIVGRVVLAREAQKEGLDKTPDFALQKQKVIDALLVQSLEQKVLSQVPKPTNEEIESFVRGHPDIFAERKLYVLDQIRIQRPSDPGIVKALEPLKTMEQIVALLSEHKVPFQRGRAQLDAVGTDPRLIDAIVKMPPGEVFVVPQGQFLLIDQVVEQRTEPFVGPQALAYAGQVMTRQRASEAVRRRFSEIASAAGSTIKFNKDYAPQKAQPGAAKPGQPNSAAPATPAAPSASGDAAKH